MTPSAEELYRQFDCHVDFEGGDRPESHAAFRRRMLKRQKVEDARQKFEFMMDGPFPPQSEREMLRRAQALYGSGILAWVAWQFGSFLVQQVLSWLWKKTWETPGVAGSPEST